MGNPHVPFNKNTRKKVIVRYLSFFLENNVLYYGFRNKRPCLSQLIDFFHGIIKSLNEGKDVEIVYVDFAKAFDTAKFHDEN